MEGEQECSVCKLVRRITAVGIAVASLVTVWRWKQLPKGAAAAARPRTDAASLFNSGRSYSTFRPTYPRSLYESIQAYAGDGPRKLAVDVGAGTGQATVPLRAWLGYQEVIGVEDSDEQREVAQRYDGVSYVKGRAEALPVADGAADLVTVAQAAHWFDLPKFFSEAHRVLRPGGTLAIWSYGLLTLDNPAATEALVKYHTVTMGPYWDERRVFVDNNYRDISIPPSLFTDIERRHLDLNLWEGKDVTLSFLMDYLGTWSSFKSFRDKNPSSPDPRDRLLKELLACYKATDSSVVRIEPRFKVTLLLGRKKISV